MTTERIDHTTEARRILDNYAPDYTIALAHATLALVEQQRIANLIALNMYRENVAPARSDIPHWQILPDIKKALGIS